MTDHYAVNSIKMFLAVFINRIEDRETRYLAVCSYFVPLMCRAEKRIVESA